jgi:hypothetical protein
MSSMNMKILRDSLASALRAIGKAGVVGYFYTYSKNHDSNSTLSNSTV